MRAVKTELQMFTDSCGAKQRKLKQTRQLDSAGGSRGRECNTAMALFTVLGGLARKVRSLVLSVVV